MLISLTLRNTSWSSSPYPFMMKFHELLKRARIENGLTQEEVAEMLCCTQSTYWQYEKGLRHPPFTRVLGIAGALGLTPAAVIAWLPERKRSVYMARLERLERRTPPSPTDPALMPRLQELRRSAEMDPMVRISFDRVLQWLRQRLPEHRA